MTRPKNKYRKGFLYHSISDLLYDLEQGRWIYWHNKVMHPGWVISMTLRTVAGAIRSQTLSEAIDQHKEYYAKQQEEYIRKLNSK
jgi:hypothetical protein